MFRFTSATTKLLKGGETMKTLGLVLGLTLVLGGVAFADNMDATIDVYAGWNLISCTQVPMNLSVTEGDGLDYTEPMYCMAVVIDDLAAGTLTRFNATDGSWPVYDGIPGSPFGKLLLGDGYQFRSSITTAINYRGVPDGVPGTDGKKTDMWISLPGLKTDANTEAPVGGGWALIGTPYATDVQSYPLNEDGSFVTDTEGNMVWNINFTDGTSVKSWMAAIEAEWVSGTMFAISDGFMVPVAYDDATPPVLKAGRGYWVKTFKDDIAMIITAPAN